jgi:hypothetical protein
METAALTFKLLDKHIENTPEHSSFKTGRRAKWGYAVVATAGTSMLILGKQLPAQTWTTILLVVLLAVEIIALIVAITADLPSAKLTPAFQRKQYVEVLDFDMPHHGKLIAWLRSFPTEQRKAMSDFATYRLERTRSKLPLLTGSIEKVGALPVLAALVIQFKDASWPLHLSSWQITLFAALTFFYWLCLVGVSLRLRLELYDTLLKKALA